MKTMENIDLTLIIDVYQDDNSPSKEVILYYERT